MVLFFGWAGYALYIAKDVSPLTSQENFFRSDHKISKIYDIIATEFTSVSLRSIHVDIYWGVKDINKLDVSGWNPEEIG